MKLIDKDAVWDVMQELWGTSGELMDRFMSLPTIEAIPKDQYEARLKADIDKIRAEIADIYVGYRHGYEVMADVLDVFDKYEESEDGNDD